MSAFAAIFITINPISKVPFFLVLTDGYSREDRRKVILNAIKVSIPILIIFALVGKYIFLAFGVESIALKFFGGFVLLKIGWDMLRGQIPKFKGSPEEEIEAVDRAMVGVVPLAIPMIAGPGSIITVMIFTGEAYSLLEYVFILVSIISTVLFAYFLLIESELIMEKIGKIGIQSTMRIMGMIIGAIGIQTILESIVVFSTWF